MAPPLVVVVFLRGGADGLALVPPWADPGYHDARPGIAIGEPESEGGALDLDGHFGLHPSLEPLLPLWNEGELAVVHALGSDDSTRSHFEAQDRMERASSRADGWLARHLKSRPGELPGALSAVAFGPSLPESLRGAPAAAIGSLADYAVEGDDPWRAALAELWAGPSVLERAGSGALNALERVRALSHDPVEMPETAFGGALADVARLVRADVGLEVAHIDLGNWDTHFVQTGLIDGLAGDLAGGLAAFRTALGAAWSRTTVVVMTEFGRRIYENASLGTDHGRGGAAFVLGGAVRGGRLYGDWPGLEPVGLEARDLPVATDFRDLLSDIVLWSGNADLERVFPGWDPAPLGLLAPAER